MNPYRKIYIAWSPIGQPQVNGPAVINADDEVGKEIVQDLRKSGWRIEGPYVLAEAIQDKIDDWTNTFNHIEDDSNLIAFAADIEEDL